MNKTFVQDCFIFISGALFIISLPFWLIEYEICIEIGYVLAMSGFCLGTITLLHKMIFGDV